MKIDDSAVVETISLQNRLRCIIDDSLMVEVVSLFFHRKSWSNKLIRHYSSEIIWCRKGWKLVHFGDPLKVFFSARWSFTYHVIYTLLQTLQEALVGCVGKLTTCTWSLKKIRTKNIFSSRRNLVLKKNRYFFWKIQKFFKNSFSKNAASNQSFWECLQHRI